MTTPVSNSTTKITTHNAAEWKGQVEPLYRIDMKKIGEWTGPSPADSGTSPGKIKVLNLGITREEWDKSRK